MIESRSLFQIRREDHALVGGKGMNLFLLHENGYAIPPGVCLGTSVYHHFISESRLGDSIAFELNRKSFADMRWEEIWDAALRIRNLFLRTPYPDALSVDIRRAIEDFCGDKPMVVRSSSNAEDSVETSFAGLHESYVNIRGMEDILHHVKLVWASLWSDRALMYRKELDLDPFSSGMAVIIQELVHGDASGVAFSRSPEQPDMVVVESVSGLNQSLVDGSIEPHRWHLRRNPVEIIQRKYPSWNQTTIPSETGSGIRIIDGGNTGIPPVTDDAVVEVTETVLDIECLFGYPVDVEWTRTGTDLILLQVRPITRSEADSSDKRPWYRSLTRSFENLKHLRSIIQNEIIPGMEESAKVLSDISFSSYNNEQIASEIHRRMAVHTSWRDRYWQDCIPFAHGMRLFGHIYNDIMQPEDPYEFMELLRNQELISIRRNRLLWEMVEEKRLIQQGDQTDRTRLEELMRAFLEQFEAEMQVIAMNTQESNLTAVVDGLLDEMAKSSFTPDSSAPRPRSDLEKQFLDQFSEDPHFAREILDLGRASYRWRDDDNHYLSRIHHEVQRAMTEGLKRLGIPDEIGTALNGEQVAELLMGKDLQPTHSNQVVRTDIQESVIPRQLTGQPASPGMAKGMAHVITSGSDLFSIRSGEILICDAIKPEMTFAVPVASAIVERRGGMLIHGAIIAREYGIPCITGVADVTKYIKTGDEIFVDAYVGIVTVISHR